MRDHKERVQSNECAVGRVDQITVYVSWWLLRRVRFIHLAHAHLVGDDTTTHDRRHVSADAELSKDR
jgi:hypothetical protein